MLVVDGHQHVGPCRVFDLDQPEERLISTMDDLGVNAAIVQPFPGAPDPVAVHNQIASLAAKYPGRIFGIMSMSPHMDPNAYFAEASRCVRELGFVAIKMHTIGHAVNPLSKDGEMIFDVAQQLKVPVMAHTGAGIPFAAPSMLIPRAKQFPEVKVVLAHAGGSMMSGEAYVAAKTCENIYLETSWCPSADIGMMVRDLGPQRVMMGADLVENVATEITKYRTQGLTEDQLRISLGDAAIELYQLNVGGAR